MLCPFTFNFLQQNLRKLATNGVFTVECHENLNSIFAGFIISQKNKKIWIKKWQIKNSDENTVQTLLEFFFKFFV